MIDIYIIITLGLFFLCLAFYGLSSDILDDAGGFWSTLPILLPSTIFFSWCLFFAYDFYYTEIKMTTRNLESYSVNNIDFVIDNNVFINLNRMFGKRFEDRTIITKKTTIYDRILLDNEEVEYNICDQ